MFNARNDHNVTKNKRNTMPAHFATQDTNSMGQPSTMKQTAKICFSYERSQSKTPYFSSKIANNIPLSS